jgi:hypothetical protein
MARKMLLIPAVMATALAGCSGSDLGDAFKGMGQAGAALSLVGVAIMLPFIAVALIDRMSEPAGPVPQPAARPDPATLDNDALCMESIMHGQWNGSNYAIEAERRGFDLPRCMTMLPERHVCLLASAPHDWVKNIEPETWDADPKFQAYVLEAQHRGHSPQSCLRLRGLKAAAAPNRFAPLMPAFGALSEGQAG